MPLLPPPSTTAKVDKAAISAVGSIPLPPLATTTAIAAVGDHHCRCHTVDNNNRQKPAVMFVIDSGNGSHRQWKRRLMAAAAMVIFVDSSHCGRRRQWDGGMMMQWH
jgi:hypothetical protein